MAIVSSSYSVAGAEVDGSRLVRETHVDGNGDPHVIDYLAAPTTDKDALLALHATQLAEQLAEQEAEELLNG